MNYNNNSINNNNFNMTGDALQCPRVEALDDKLLDIIDERPRYYEGLKMSREDAIRLSLEHKLKRRDELSIKHNLSTSEIEELIEMCHSIPMLVMEIEDYKKSREVMQLLAD